LGFPSLVGRSCTTGGTVPDAVSSKALYRSIRKLLLCHNDGLADTVTFAPIAVGFTPIDGGMSLPCRGAHRRRVPQP
jgi:hypothetical protein